MVQHAAAGVLTRTRKYDHITPVLSTLHWLPIKHRIDFKILLITYKALNGLSELLSHYSPPRPLRSQNSGRLIIPRISKSTFDLICCKSATIFAIYVFYSCDAQLLQRVEICTDTQSDNTKQCCVHFV